MATPTDYGDLEAEVHPGAVMDILKGLCLAKELATYMKDLLEGTMDFTMSIWYKGGHIDESDEWSRNFLD